MQGNAAGEQCTRRARLAWHTGVVRGEVAVGEGVARGSIAARDQCDTLLSHALQQASCEVAAGREAFACVIAAERTCAWRPLDQSKPLA